MPVMIKYVCQEDDEFEEFETDDWDIRKEDQTDVKVSKRFPSKCLVEHRNNSKIRMWVVFWCVSFYFKVN